MFDLHRLKIITIAILFIGLASIVIPQSSVAASAYKWVDENGVTYFGDKPPVKQQPEIIHLDTKPSSSAQQEKSQANALIEQLENKAVEDKAQKQKAASTAKEQATQEENCKRAQQNLEAINKAKPPYAFEKNGERQALTPDEYEKLKSETQKQIDFYCHSKK